jgi:hypothetical protein
MPNFNVLLEGAWLVRDVKTEGDAIGAAIPEAVKRPNQRKMDFVKGGDGPVGLPGVPRSLDGSVSCGQYGPGGSLLEIKIFNDESEENECRAHCQIQHRKSSGGHTAVRAGDGSDRLTGFFI